MDFADGFRRFVGLTLAVLASVAIGMLPILHTKISCLVSLKCVYGIWLCAKEANLVDSRVELCHYKKGPYHNPTKRSERC